MTPTKPAGLYRRGNTYWTKVYVNGVARRESTGTDRLTEARRILDARRGAVATGMPLPRAGRATYDTAASDLRLHYQTTGSRNLAEVDIRFAHLAAIFAGKRLASIGGAEATAYVAHRQGEGVANGTINRELDVLKKALRLAVERGVLHRLPLIRRLKAAGPRQGFFERDAFEAVRGRLPADLQVAVSVAYALGWRMRSEILRLERRHLDLAAGTLRLDPGTTKNDEGRIAYVPADLGALLAEQMARVDLLSRKLGRVVVWLFPHLRGRLQGQRIQGFTRTWQSACRRAGAPGMLVHDLRRTAVRNAVNLGIPERVAMKISGHRTRAIFDNYHIVSPLDLQDAARRLEGHNPGTIAPAAPSKLLR